MDVEAYSVRKHCYNADRVLGAKMIGENKKFSIIFK